ncbi:dnaJ homolog subfamily C member 28 [Macrosteles quadrilineatus]|uniref:dnaJ homolog subfamily C member 28 n=1 Tax=Macrosteles quadrilineatus TaxID=74068 RepID=UPI0023E201B3|nr:dnaJ homolog subfamily C member 28 [Macrosteles quadrilineatus]XP_054289080.1 dnaJ homolog subfamily C member 28 [Macrosteles quadrilineatus]
MELVVRRFPLLKNGKLLRCCYCFIEDRSAIRFYATQLRSAEYTRCYNVLGVKEDSDQETVRQAFLKLVKRYHPDSGSTDADPQRFQEIEKAYRKLQQKFHAERWSDRWSESAGEYGLYYKEKKGKDNVPVVEHDIKHTAPQHRQYLSYDGVGVGTPTQRHKQYQKQRAATAVENVYSHRVTKLQQDTLSEEQALVVKDKQRARNIKTRYGMDRLVEDLIQESMAKGEFDNLSGKGKPLTTKQDHHNPYVDLVTHKLNQVMIDNGFMPEWIMLQKEIREDIERLRERLRRVRDQLPPPPLSEEQEERWSNNVKNYREDVQTINGKIEKFNLVVPLLYNQMLLFDLDKEATKIAKEMPTLPQKKEKLQGKQSEEHRSGDFLNKIMSIFSG